MKKQYTIFFDKGVIKAFETPKKKSFPAIEYKDPLWEAARLSALPVSNQDEEKVLRMIKIKTKYVCEHCGEQFKNEIDLQAHQWNNKYCPIHDPNKNIKKP